MHRTDVGPEWHGSQEYVKPEGHEHLQVEEHDNHVVWISRGCALPDEDVNVVIRNEESQGGLDLSRYEGAILVKNLMEPRAMIILEVEGVGCSLAYVAQGGEVLGDVP
ncbi:hypothetical protein V6N13_130517 [Hibiscus sabdariffa]|uniref:Uncharacterized protein n=1 Tax=Hibiscus sabdariffa TaxID=183260 RepID=A0ABR2B6A9_9ROSI